MLVDRRQLISTIGGALLSLSGDRYSLTNSLTNTSDNESENESEGGVCEGELAVSATTIRFYSEITSESCTSLQDLIKTAQDNSKIMQKDCNLSDPVPIHLHLKSTGGSLLETFYILDLITSSDVPIYSYVDGYCASAASLISVVAKKRFMTKHSFVLLHQLSSQVTGHKFSEIEDEVQNLNTFMKAMKEVYLENTGLSSNELDELLNKDIWLDATECLKYKIVDEIV
jgi:ATP-dependent protease ClpP protease subunit